MRSELIHKIFSMSGTDKELVLQVYRYQYENNPLYKRFSDTLGRHPDTVADIAGIPFLPIRFFKSHLVQTGEFEPEEWFESSGTTGTVNSRHLVRSLDLYRRSFTEGFRFFYGDPRNWCILGLLPAYLERQHSSLVVMVDDLIRQSGHADSGFYLYDHENLAATLDRLEASAQKTLLIGVSFALLDFAEKYPRKLACTTIMETGGMKGRRKEITRSELHAILSGAFGGAPIHSEYGMTELLSQSYCGDNGLFYCPPWMSVLLREEDDPQSILAASPDGWHPTGGTRRVNGVINVIDLANIDSCCFIATDDMGKMHADGGFEVLGRVDNSDIRGCSLMTV